MLYILTLISVLFIVNAVLFLAFVLLDRRNQ